MDRILPSRLRHASVAWRFGLYSTLMGASGAVFGFGDVIARKSLGMSGLAVTLLTMSGPITALATIWWGAVLTGRDQRKLLLWLGVASTFILMSVGLLSSGFQLILIYYVYCFAVTVFGPCENRVMQQHLPPHTTGKLFGLANGGRTAMGAIAFVAAGFWMDHHIEGFRQVYPAGALISMIGILLIASIPTGGTETQLPMDRNVFAKPVKDVIALLKRRKDFLRFEIAFMTYGVAFMILMPVVPLFLVDDLKLSYSTIGLARGAWMQVAMIPAMMFFGRIFDRTTPHRMGAWIFTLLIFYPLLLLAAGKTEGTLRTALVYAAFAWFGVIMSGLSVIWSLSSIRFAAGEDVSIYQSVHVAATGVRGLVGPMLGYALMTIFSKEAAMVTSAVLWVIAGGMMVWMRRIDRRSGDMMSLRAQHTVTR